MALMVELQVPASPQYHGELNVQGHTNHAQE